MSTATYEPTAATTAARRDAVRATLDRHAVPAILITDLVNVRYLTGFTGSNGAVLIAADPAADRVSTDGRYLTQIAEQAPGLELVVGRDVNAALADYAVGVGLTSLGFEDHHLTVRAERQLAAAVPLVPVGAVVEELRIIKDATEIAALAKACAVGDAALAQIIGEGQVRPGRSEREIARDLEWAMFALGADEVSFETIVATGANSAIPHHRPTGAVVREGDFVKFDFGATVGGYHSDMTRTFVVGEPQPWQREIYEIVRAAQQAGREALAVGADLAGIDAAARDLIVDAGYGENYLHGLGHGVGLEIHEAPGIGQTATGTLPDGAAVTVEPGIYLAGRGGVRIEDTLVVHEDGPQLLTSTSKDLTIL